MPFFLLEDEADDDDAGDPNPAMKNCVDDDDRLVDGILRAVSDRKDVGRVDKANDDDVDNKTVTTNVVVSNSIFCIKAISLVAEAVVMVFLFDIERQGRR